MADSKILDKLSKLLAMSESGNPNEAAIALERARKLMEAHQLSTEDVALRAINETEEKVPSILKDKRMYTILSSIVTRAFGLTCFYRMNGSTVKSVVFVGPSDRCQTATYTFTVLARQAAIAKKNFLARRREELLNEWKEANPFFMEIQRCKRLSDIYKLVSESCKNADNRNLRRSATAYLDGWMRAIHEKVTDFAMTSEENHLIERFMEENHPDLTTMSRFRGRGYSRSDWQHFQNGSRDAEEGVTLLHGVSGDMQRHELGYDGE